MTLVESFLDVEQEPRAFRWTREAYSALYDQGVFDGRRVELIDGEIVEMSGQKDAHAWALGTIEDELRAVAGLNSWVRPQMPLELSQWSDPEPDIAVVAGSRSSWRGKGHPATAILVVEVSDKTLLFDRRVKQAIYAAASLPEYWILNLVDRQLEVFRDPQPNASNVRASRYRTMMVVALGSRVSPLAFPSASILVDDLIA